jgi:LuxR family maltose regulon positive regulatory protein
LLATKLYARPARADLVARPHLITLLDAGLAASLILVSAPAGFGKTTLLAEWVRRGRSRAGWLSLDAADNDPVRFLTYVIAALQRVTGDAAGELAGLLHFPEPPTVEAVLAALVNAISPAVDDLVLVFDDYHVITSPPVHSAVTFLLEHLPANLHLVVSTRADPPIPIARLRSQGRVVEVRAEELCFTPEEAAAFLNHTMGLSLSPAQAAALDKRTEGWIAGLQMAALSMRGREDVDSFIQAFAGTHRFILDFLAEEVLGRESPEVQTFLLHTAVLTRLCGPLCDAVTGVSGSRQMLERLERRNLFVIPLDDNRCWYRYHHLFADLLQARLHQLEPERVPQLRRRAADWCEQDGQVADALDYALAAKDYVRAGELVARYWGPVANEGQIETVWAWLSALPEEMVRNSALLSVACCWVLWLKGRNNLIETHLVDAETALNTAAPKAEDKDSAAYALLPVQLATLRSFVARYHAQFAAAVAHAEHARRLAAGEDLPPGDGALHAQLHALIALALATAYDGAGDLDRAADAYMESIRWSRRGRNATGVAVTYRLAGVLRLLGRLRAAEAACREALQFLEEQGMARLPAAGVLHMALAEVLLERNELAAAEDHLARGSELGKHSGRLDAVRNAAAALARLRLERGDVEGALAAVLEAQAALGEHSSPLARAELLSLRAKVLLRQGSLGEAAACSAEAERLAAQERGLTAEIVTLAAARVRLAQGSADETVKQLTQSLAAAEARGWFGAVIEWRILRSLALAQQGDMRAAEANLQGALALAEPRGYVRLFLDEGEPMAEMLRAPAMRLAWTDDSSKRPAQFLTALIDAFDAPGNEPPATNAPASDPAVTASVPARAERRAASEQPPAMIEPLSERELEVLRLMAEGLTNEQIARRLIIALGTVKAHIHHIAGKLAAQNRAHAVARAQELGLL